MKMGCSLNGCGSGTQFALVSYLPEPLGSFLTKYRTEVVPSCQLRSHVTILPPRILSAPTPMLEEELRQRLRDVPPFEITLGDIEMFPVTNVIYISIKHGKDQIIKLHGELSQELFHYDEPFPFHPHVTLAQELHPENVKDVYERTCRMWRENPYSRTIPVDHLVFVKSADKRGWEQISEYDLQQAPLQKTA